MQSENIIITVDDYVAPGDSNLQSAVYKILAITNSYYDGLKSMFVERKVSSSVEGISETKRKIDITIELYSSTLEVDDFLEAVDELKFYLHKEYNISAL